LEGLFAGEAKLSYLGGFSAEKVMKFRVVLSTNVEYSGCRSEIPGEREK
jgi:hypothetical protein